MTARTGVSQPINNLRNDVRNFWERHKIAVVMTALIGGAVAVGSGGRLSLLFREDLPFIGGRLIGEFVKLYEYGAALLRGVGGSLAIVGTPARVRVAEAPLDRLVGEMLHDREAFRMLLGTILGAPNRSVLRATSSEFGRSPNLHAFMSVLDESEQQAATRAAEALARRIGIDPGERRGSFLDLLFEEVKWGRGEELDQAMREPLKRILRNWSGEELWQIRDAAVRSAWRMHRHCLNRALLFSGETGDQFHRRLVQEMAPWRRRACDGWLEDAAISVRTETRLSCVRQMVQAMKPEVENGGGILATLNRGYDRWAVPVDQFLERRWDGAALAIGSADPGMHLFNSRQLCEKVLLRQVRQSQVEFGALGSFVKAATAHPELGSHLAQLSAKEQLLAVGVAARKEQSRHLAPYLPNGDAIETAAREMRSVTHQADNGARLSVFEELADDFGVSIEREKSAARGVKSGLDNLMVWIDRVFSEELRRAHRLCLIPGAILYVTGSDGGFQEEIGVCLMMAGGNYYVERIGLVSTWAMDVMILQRTLNAVISKWDADSDDLFDIQRVTGNYFASILAEACRMFLFYGINAAPRVPWGGILANLPFLRLLPAMNAPLWFRAYGGGTNKPSFMGKGVWWLGLPLNIAYSMTMAYGIAYFVTKNERVFNASDDYALQQAIYYFLNGAFVNPLGFMVNRYWEVKNPFADIRTVKRQATERLFGILTSYLSLQMTDIFAGKGDYRTQARRHLRMARDGDPEALDDAWQDFSSRYSIDITGTWYREDLIPPYDEPDGRYWSPHFLGVSFHRDQLRSWFTEGEMTFSDKKGHQGFFVELARQELELKYEQEDRDRQLALHEDLTRHLAIQMGQLAANQMEIENLQDETVWSEREWIAPLDRREILKKEMELTERRLQNQKEEIERRNRVIAALRSQDYKEGLLKTFFRAFEKQLEDKGALWRTAGRGYKREAEVKSVYHFSLYARFRAYQARTGVPAYKPFADLIERSPFQDYWKGVPEPKTEGELMQALILSEDWDHVDSPAYGYIHRDTLLARLLVSSDGRSAAVPSPQTVQLKKVVEEITPVPEVESPKEPPRRRPSEPPEVELPQVKPPAVEPPRVVVKMTQPEACVPLQGREEVACVNEMLQARFKDDLACGIREGDEGPRLDCCVKDGGGCLSNFNVFNSVSGPYEEEPGCYEEKMEELHARGAFWVHYHPLGSTANQRARQVDSEIQRMLESYYVCYTPSWW